MPYRSQWSLVSIQLTYVLCCRSIFLYLHLKSALRISFSTYSLVALFIHHFAVTTRKRLAWQRCHHFSVAYVSQFHFLLLSRSIAS